MTNPHLDQDINYGPDEASVFSRTLGGTEQGTTDTAVLNFITITNSSADHFTVGITAAATVAGTTITILQPGVYIASVNAAIAAAACTLGISVGATLPPFTTAPVAFATAESLIALATDVGATATIQMCSASFRVSPADITGGVANIVRFLATVGGNFVDTQATFRIDRATAS